MWKKYKDLTPSERAAHLEAVRRYHAAHPDKRAESLARLKARPDYPAIRKAAQARYYAGKFVGRRSSWSVIEDTIVLESKQDDHAISLAVGHSVKAVQIRRCRLKAELKALEVEITSKEKQ